MTGWIEVSGPQGTQRFPLQAGLTRLGAGDAEIDVPGVGEDEVHLWDDPPRVVFVGAGLPPTSQGVPFTERGLEPGDRFEWCGTAFRIGPGPQDEGAPAKVPGEAVVMEVGPGAGGAASGARDASVVREMSPSPSARLAATGAGKGQPTHQLTGVEVRIWNRMRAGLLADQGLADSGTLERLQRQALDGKLSIEEASLELIASAKDDDGGRRILERSGRLMRDFIMAPLNTRTRSAGRAAKRKTQNLVAFLIAQGVALGVFALIVGLILFFVRLRGVSLDAFFDRLAPG